MNNHQTCHHLLQAYSQLCSVVPAHNTSLIGASSPPSLWSCFFPRDVAQFSWRGWTSNKPLMRNSPVYFPQFWGGKKLLPQSDGVELLNPKLRMNSLLYFYILCKLQHFRYSGARSCPAWVGMCANIAGDPTEYWMHIGTRLTMYLMRGGRAFRCAPFASVNTLPACLPPIRFWRLSARRALSSKGTREEDT